MGAEATLHDFLRKRVGFVHKARWESLWRVTLALIQGKKLWLSALGRALPGDVKRKHAIKAVDRLLGNEKLHRERVPICRGLASLLLSPDSCPVLLLDSMEIRHRVVAFTASIAHEGRSFPIYSRVFASLRIPPEDFVPLLDELAVVLPDGCSPTLVTDGGFEDSWFRELEKRGWNYVGRLRGQVSVCVDNEWLRCPQLHQKAGSRPKDLGLARFPKRNPSERRVVLSALRSSRHRQVKTRTGPSRGSNYQHYRKNAYEPLVLATTLSSLPAEVVGIYSKRMQIEQNFRDAKNHRWGWSLRHCGCRSSERIENLLLIGILAALVQQWVGAVAEREGLHHQHQANTIRSRRVLSLFLLGGLILNDRRSIRFTRTQFRHALQQFRSGPSIRGDTSVRGNPNQPTWDAAGP